MNQMTNKQELEMWSKILALLQTIPNDYRSRNHSEYMDEVEYRIHHCYDAEEHLQNIKKP